MHIVCWYIDELLLFQGLTFIMWERIGYTDTRLELKWKYTDDIDDDGGDGDNDEDEDDDNDEDRKNADKEITHNLNDEKTKHPAQDLLTICFRSSVNIEAKSQSVSDLLCEKWLRYIV